MRSLLVCAVVLAVTPSSHAAELKCEIRQKFFCEESGCSTTPAKVWNLVDMSNKTYARCDSMGCDKYPAQFSASGIFINIDVPGRGLTAKISADSFHEIATLGHAIYVKLRIMQAQLIVWGSTPVGGLPGLELRFSRVVCGGGRESRTSTIIVALGPFLDHLIVASSLEPFLDQIDELKQHHAESDEERHEDDDERTDFQHVTHPRFDETTVCYPMDALAPAQVKADHTVIIRYRRG
jgi:hypothetical protein